MWSEYFGVQEACRCSFDLLVVVIGFCRASLEQDRPQGAVSFISLHIEASAKKVFIEYLQP